MSPIAGKTASTTRNEERASLPAHGPVLVGVKLTADDGIYPVGLLLTRNAADVAKALVLVVGEILAAGDGATKAFAGTLAAALPLEPGMLVITDGVETFYDDGCGRLVGDAAGTGTIDYVTGDFSVSFNADVVNAVDVLADYITAVDGVLDAEVDTSASQVGLSVDHGSVAKDVLKVGAVAKAAPSAALLKKMRGNGIYPM